MPPPISFKRYQRRFALPLQTARGEWSLREGFVLRVEAGGRVGYGEVAPIPEFGTESLEAAAKFLRQLAANPERPVPAELPCCAFALSSALDSALDSVAGESAGAARDYPVAALLPAGPEAVGVAAEKIAHDYRTLKWKVGVDRQDREQATLRLLVATTPKHVKIRLDANASWSVKTLEQWLAFMQPFGERIEYLEQPLAVGEELSMARLASAAGIPIALDESLNGLHGRQWLGAWEGPLVVKPALMGDLQELMALLRPVAERVVLSSVFETGVGLLSVLRMADALPGLGRAIGFDTQNFTDGLSLRESSACLTAADRSAISPDQIWKHLPHLT